MYKENLPPINTQPKTYKQAFNKIYCFKSHLVKNQSPLVSHREISQVQFNLATNQKPIKNKQLYFDRKNQQQNNRQNIQKISLQNMITDQSLLEVITNKINANKQLVAKRKSFSFSSQSKNTISKQNKMPNFVQQTKKNEKIQIQHLKQQQNIQKDQRKIQNKEQTSLLIEKNQIGIDKDKNKTVNNKDKHIRCRSFIIKKKASIYEKDKSDAKKDQSQIVIFQIANQKNNEMINKIKNKTLNQTTKEKIDKLEQTTKEKIDKIEQSRANVQKKQIIKPIKVLKVKRNLKRNQINSQQKIERDQKIKQIQNEMTKMDLSKITKKEQSLGHKQKEQTIQIYKEVKTIELKQQLIKKDQTQQTNHKLKKQQFIQTNKQQQLQQLQQAKKHKNQQLQQDKKYKNQFNQTDHLKNQNLQQSIQVQSAKSILIQSNNISFNYQKPLFINFKKQKKKQIIQKLSVKKLHHNQLQKINQKMQLPTQSGQIFQIKNRFKSSSQAQNKAKIYSSIKTIKSFNEQAINNIQKQGKQIKKTQADILSNKQFLNDSLNFKINKQIFTQKAKKSKPKQCFTHKINWGIKKDKKQKQFLQSFEQQKNVLQNNHFSNQQKKELGKNKQLISLFNQNCYDFAPFSKQLIQFQDPGLSAIFTKQQSTKQKQVETYINDQSKTNIEEEPLQSLQDLYCQLKSFKNLDRDNDK